MLDGNLSVLSSPLQHNVVATSQAIANAVPSNRMRIVEPVNNNSRSKEYVQNQNFRELYAKNLSPSAAIATETYLKAYAALSPIYANNEAKTKYDMISQIGLKNLDIREKVDVIA